MSFTRFFSALITCSFLFSSAVAAPRVALLMRDHSLFYTAVEKGFNEAAQKAGAEAVVRSPGQANQPGVQRALLVALQAEKIDALVISPLVAEETSSLLAEMRAKGVKVVIIDAPAASEQGDVTVDFDQASMALGAAQAFAKLYGGEDSAGVLRANSLDSFTPREKAFLKALKEVHPAGTLFMDVMAGAVAGDDEVQSSQLLLRHPNMKAVATLFSAPSLGMIRALEKQGLSGKVAHLAFGSGLPAEARAAVEKGALSVWVAQQPGLLGQRGLEVALKLVAGEKLPQRQVVEHVLVTKETLASPEVAALSK